MLDVQGSKVVDIRSAGMRNRAADAIRSSCQLVPSEDYGQQPVDVQKAECGIWRRGYGTNELARLDRKAEYLFLQIHIELSLIDDARQPAQGRTKERAEASPISHVWLTGLAISLLLAACGIS